MDTATSRRPQLVVSSPVSGQPDQRWPPLEDVELYDDTTHGQGRPNRDGVPVTDIVVRAVVAFLFVLLLTRLIGRCELSSLQPFDLMLLIVMAT